MAVESGHKVTVMHDYIGRDAVYHAISVDGGLNAYEKAYCIDIVRKIPAADVAPVRTGRLVNANRRAKTYQRICTVCGDIAYFCGVGCSYNFCPNCGARMDGVDKSDE